MVRVTLDPKNPSKGMTDWQRVNAMTEEEITEAAMSDPDAQPVTEEELKHFRPVPNIKAIRQKLKLSQHQFAETYHLSVRTVQEWEQGRSPDRTAIAFLTAIANAPDAVRKALN